MTNRDVGYLTKKDGSQFYPVANWAYVDDKPDLSVFAKTTDLTTAISQIPKIDLSGYATTKSVTDAISAIPKTDLSNYVTKADLSKVEDEITTLKSPDGSTWFLSVDNDGNLSTSKLITRDGN